jgi:fructoselysine-6-P-deglycase FrlB-like protein
MNSHISYATARATQRDSIGQAVSALAVQVLRQQRAGAFRGPGPLFVGIGASLAAACSPVWVLRSRGIESWRLSAGDVPLPFPLSPHPLFAVSQGGRSAETLAAFESVPADHRYAVVNADPSPISSAAPNRLVLGEFADSYASTIGFTATVVGLGMIAEAWDGGAIDTSWQDLPGHMAEVERSAAGYLSTSTLIDSPSTSLDFVATGSSLGSAEAGALLVREVARIPTAAMSTRQYLHGAIESAATSRVVLIGDDREVELATTLTGSGVPVLLITTQPVDQRALLETITLPAVTASQRTILEVVVLQAIAGALAEARDLDIEEFVFHSDDTKVSHATL